MRVLETERLSLRWLCADDAPFVLELMNEPSFIANIGDRGVRTLEQARHYLLNGPVESYARLGHGLYLVELRDRAAPIGMCGLVKREFLPDADVGFAFRPSYWSQGYAFEAAAAVMDYAREVLAMPRVVAIVSPGNGASIRLLRRIGLRFDRMIEAPDAEHRCALFAPVNADGR